MAFYADPRVKEFLATSLRPFAEVTYGGLVTGEELIEFYETEIKPLVESTATGVSVDNPYYVDAGTTPTEPAQIDEAYLQIISDANSQNGKAPVTIYDMMRIVALLTQLQTGLDGSRSILRKACVRPSKGG